MKRIFTSLISLLFVTSIFGQNKFGIGITGGPDLNFYKYSDYKFRDNERSNKISFGFSAGIILNYKLNDKFDLYSNVVYANKNYSPDRTFHFGVLRIVKFKTLDIPLNLKYNFKELDGRLNRLYLLGGLSYQIEIDKKSNYDFFDDFENSNYSLGEMNYIIPNIGVGIEKNWKENKLIRMQLNYRLFKCHCEYLNPWIDKISLEIAVIKTLGNK